MSDLWGCVLLGVLGVAYVLVLAWALLPTGGVPCDQPAGLRAPGRPADREVQMRTVTLDALARAGTARGDALAMELVRGWQRRDGQDRD